MAFTTELSERYETPFHMAGLTLAEAAPEADVVLVNGMANWRGPDGVPQRTLHRVAELEDLVGRPIFSAHITLYWPIYRTLGIGPVGRGHGRLLDSLTGPDA